MKLETLSSRNSTESGPWTRAELVIGSILLGVFLLWFSPMTLAAERPALKFAAQCLTGKPATVLSHVCQFEVELYMRELPDYVYCGARDISQRAVLRQQFKLHRSELPGMTARVAIINAMVEGYRCRRFTDPDYPLPL